MLSKHNFNVLMQDSTDQKYRSVKSTQNGNTITIGNFIIDADGMPQKYTPVPPVIDLGVLGNGGGSEETKVTIEDGSATYDIPAGKALTYIVVTPVSAANYSVGTTDGGEQIIPETDHTDFASVFEYADGAPKTIYFNNNQVGTRIVLFLKTI